MSEILEVCKPNLIGQQELRLQFPTALHWMMRLPFHDPDKKRLLGKFWAEYWKETIRPLLRERKSKLARTSHYTLLPEQEYQAINGIACCLNLEDGLVPRLNRRAFGVPAQPPRGRKFQLYFLSHHLDEMERADVMLMLANDDKVEIHDQDWRDFDLEELPKGEAFIYTIPPQTSPDVAEIWQRNLASREIKLHLVSVPEVYFEEPELEEDEEEE